MATKKQVMYGLAAFVEEHMIPKAKGNYKIILRTAKVSMLHALEKTWDIIKDNSFIKMLGVADGEEIDIDDLCSVLVEGFAEDEFSLSFNFLGKEYQMHLSAEDIRAAKGYIERS